MDEEPALPDVGPATDSQQARLDALSVAVAFVAAMTDTSVPVDQWRAQLRPLVDDTLFRQLGGCDGCGDVDASWFNLGKPTGPGQLSGLPVPVLAVVDVPTSRGSVAVTMTRLSDGAPWLVGRFE